MYTLAHFTTLVAAWTATTVGAVPLNHASAHQDLHLRDKSPHLVKLAPLRARAPEPQNISPTGQCGGDSGFQCASSMCCSQWGYCGTGDDYCGSGSSNDTSIATVSAEEWTSTTAPAYTAPATYTTLATTTAVATAASSAAAVPSASASSSSVSSGKYSGGKGKGNTYTFYSGSGAPSAGWPSMNEWASFETLWAANEPTIAISCTQFGAANPSTQEISEIQSAITSVGASSGVDPRFILAIMMQESKGCPRVPTTTYSHANPGLMQSYEGVSCASSNPCPASTITQMIEDGAIGTSAGPGLKDDMGTISASGAQKYYETARIYNAGSLSGDNLGAPGATECYCSDIANRLTGWTTAATQCTLS